MPAQKGRAELLADRLERFTAPLPGVEKGDVRAVHRARVASRRLREILPILGLEAARTRKIRRRLRRVTRSLGTVRELDVLSALLDDIQQKGEHAGRALHLVQEALAAERRSALGRTSSSRVAAEMARVGRKLEGVVAELREARHARRRDRAWRWALEARTARRSAALGAAIEAAGSVYLPGRLHRVRLALKKLRYAVELTHEADAHKVAADLTALRRAQDLLGRLHDRQVLADRVRHVQASRVTPDLNQWREMDALVASLERSCRGLHARYARARATLAAICDRLSTAPAGAGARRAAQLR
jgi:CHAD domain-containing protein